MFLTAFLPVLIVAGWVLVAMQPHGNWFRDHVLSWSSDIGIANIVSDLGTWIGVLAFGIGYVFCATFEPRLAFRRRKAVAPAAAPVPTYDRAATDEPTAAERTEVGAGNGATVTRERTQRTQTAR